MKIRCGNYVAVEKVSSSHQTEWKTGFSGPYRVEKQNEYVLLHNEAK